MNGWRPHISGAEHPGHTARVPAEALPAVGNHVLDSTLPLAGNLLLNLQAPNSLPTKSFAQGSQSHFLLFVTIIPDTTLLHLGQ